MFLRRSVWEVRWECHEWIDLGMKRCVSRPGKERLLASRADQRVLRWLGHVERLDESRMARWVLMAEVNGWRVLGKQRLGWMDGKNVAFASRGMTVEAARQCTNEMKEWRARVYMQMFSLEFCLTALCFQILSLYLLSEVSKFHQYSYNKCGTHKRVFSQNFSMAKVRMKQDIETEKKCEKRNVNMEAKRGGKKDFRTA